MRISLFLVLAGLFTLLPWGDHRVDSKRRRLLNVEEAVRLLGEHGTVF
jgi:predicted transporter